MVEYALHVRVIWTNTCKVQVQELPNRGSWDDEERGSYEGGVSRIIRRARSVELEFVLTCHTPATKNVYVQPLYSLHFSSSYHLTERPFLRRSIAVKSSYLVVLPTHAPSSYETCFSPPKSS